MLKYQTDPQIAMAIRGDSFLTEQEALVSPPWPRCGSILLSHTFTDIGAEWT